MHYMTLMRLSAHDDVIEALPAVRDDQTFRIAVAPTPSMEMSDDRGVGGSGPGPVPSNDSARGFAPRCGFG
jgi:hypothetical protein